MSKLKRIAVREERILEDLLIQNPEVLEEELRVLDHQVVTDSGPLDILAVDGSGVLTVIELKITESDDMLLQALRYYDWVYTNIGFLANHFGKERNVEIEEAETPRIILVAPSFSETAKRLVRYLRPSVDLFEYEYLQAPSGEQLLYCRSVELEETRPVRTPPDYLEHIDYITATSVRNACETLTDSIVEMGDRIERRGQQYYMGFKYAGSLFLRIVTRREYFYLYFPREGGWTAGEIKIATPEDITDDVLQKIQQAYVDVGGIVVQPLVEPDEDGNEEV